MSDELPEGVFAPSGLWLLATPPLSQAPLDAIRQVIQVGPAGGKYVPAFTTEALGRAFAAWLLEGTTRSLEVFSCLGSREFGLFVTNLGVIGHEYLAIDPEPDRVTRIPIRTVRDALFRHHFGHRHGGGASQN